MIAIKFLILLACVFTGYTLGYLFTEKLNISKWGLFDFEAFKCRSCLSFHISWVTSTFIALLFMDFKMLLVGIIFAFGLWLGLKVDQKRKTVNLNNYHIEKEEENDIYTE